MALILLRPNQPSVQPMLGRGKTGKRRPEWREGARRRRDAGRAGDEERELRATPRREPAREQAADGAESVEAVVVERDDAPAQVVGRAELERGVRARRPEREAGADREEQDPAGDCRVDGREEHLKPGEAARPEEEHAQARAAEAGGEECAEE